MTKPNVTTAPRTEAARFEGTALMRLEASPCEVFPLLCPVREYDWIPIWRCELLHALSGAAEYGCVFRTDFRDCGEETWLCTRYEPDRAIEYVRFAPLGLVTHLRITLGADGGGTAVHWNVAITATTEAGTKYLAGFTAARYEQETRMLESMLRHYLKTGTALPA